MISIGYDDLSANKAILALLFDPEHYSGISLESAFTLTSVSHANDHELLASATADYRVFALTKEHVLPEAVVLV